MPLDYEPSVLELGELFQTFKAIILVVNNCDQFSLCCRQWDTGEFPSDAAADLNAVYVLLKQYDAPPAAVLSVK